MKIKKIKPMYSKILTTADTFVEEKSSAGLITNAAEMKRGLNEYQKVLEVGCYVKNVQPGDMVCINPARYAEKKYSEDSLKDNLLTNQVQRYHFNIIKVDGKDCLMIEENDIDFVITDYE